ncbi:MAG: hypothetical protein ACOYPS_08055 [Phycisphaerales bacterium]
MNHAPPTACPASPAAWAAYLGASWTWCIGMWLPVILLRDLGPWSFVVFALPNVIGAAAMGWVIPTADAAERLASEHANACRLFSVVTYLFQCFFLGAVAFGGPWEPSLAIPAALAFLLPTLAGPGLAGRLGGHRLLGGVCLVASVVAAAWWWLTVRPDLTSAVASLPAANPGHLAGLASACLLGFALCPYLDLTFLRARRECANPADARVAFGVGFGLLFASMIVLTFGYGAWLVHARPDAALGPWLLPLPLVLHVCVQMGFKLLVHREEAACAEPRCSLASTLRLPLLGLGVAVAFLLLKDAPVVYGLSPFELGYRLFMTFYGLVFPAYVWLCVGSPRWCRPAPDARSLIRLVVTIAAASPFFWLGFIERRHEWTAAGVAIVIAARWVPVGRRVAGTPAA